MACELSCCWKSEVQLLPQERVLLLASSGKSIHLGEKGIHLGRSSSSLGDKRIARCLCLCRRVICPLLRSLLSDSCSSNLGGKRVASSLCLSEPPRGLLLCVSCSSSLGGKRGASSVRLSESPRVASSLYVSAGVLELCTQPLGLRKQLLSLTCKTSLSLLTSTRC